MKVKNLFFYLCLFVSALNFSASPKALADDTQEGPGITKQLLRNQTEIDSLKNSLAENGHLNEQFKYVRQHTFINPTADSHDPKELMIQAYIGLLNNYVRILEAENKAYDSSSPNFTAAINICASFKDKNLTEATFVTLRKSAILALSNKEVGGPNKILAAKNLVRFQIDSENYLRKIKISCDRVSIKNEESHLVQAIKDSELTLAGDRHDSGQVLSIKDLRCAAALLEKTGIPEEVCKARINNEGNLVGQFPSMGYGASRRVFGQDAVNPLENPAVNETSRNAKQAPRGGNEPSANGLQLPVIGRPASGVKAR